MNIKQRGIVQHISDLETTIKQGFFKDTSGWQSLLRATPLPQQQ